MEAKEVSARVEVSQLTPVSFPTSAPLDTLTASSQQWPLLSFCCEHRPPFNASSDLSSKTFSVLSPDVPVFLLCALGALSASASPASGFQDIILFNRLHGYRVGQK